MENGSEIFWAIFWMSLISFIVWALVVTSRKFICKRCGTKFKILFVDRCPSCGTYHKKEGKSISILGPGDIIDSCAFPVRYEDMKADPSEWIWPNQCCVCGGQVQRYDDFRIGLRTGQSLGGLQKEITMWKFKIPYCNIHNDGVKWQSDPTLNDTSAITNISVCFRSYNYWTLFKELNCA